MYQVISILDVQRILKNIHDAEVEDGYNGGALDVLQEHGMETSYNVAYDMLDRMQHGYIIPNSDSNVTLNQQEFDKLQKTGSATAWDADTMEILHVYHEKPEDINEFDADQLIVEPTGTYGIWFN